MRICLRALVMICAMLGGNVLMAEEISNWSLREVSALVIGPELGTPFELINSDSIRITDKEKISGILDSVVNGKEQQIQHRMWRPHRQLVALGSDGKVIVGFLVDLNPEKNTEGARVVLRRGTVKKEGKKVKIVPISLSAGFPCSELERALGLLKGK